MNESGPSGLVQSKKPRYAVVTFHSNTDEKSLAVIPITWIKSELDTYFCFWPRKTVPNVRQLIIKGVKPSADWLKHEITILETYDSYDLALKREQKEVALLSDSELLGRGHRKIKKRKIHIGDTSDDTESESGDDHNPLMHKRQRLIHIQSRAEGTDMIMENFIWSQDEEKFPSIPELAAATTPIAITEDNVAFVDTMQDPLTLTSEVGTQTCKTLPITMTSVKEEFSPGPSSNSVTGKCCNCDPSIKTILADMQSTLHLILNRLNNTNYLDVNYIGKREDKLPEFPIKCIDDFITFEDTLLHDQEVGQQLESKLFLIGGTNNRNTVNRSLKFVFSKEIAVSFSWKGQKNNIRLEGLKVMEILQNAVSKHYPQMTDREYIQYVMDWFRFSKQRLDKH